MVIDVHAHHGGFLPAWARRLYRALLHRTIPAVQSARRVAEAGVDAVVVNAVGDRFIGWLRGRGALASVQRQLGDIRTETAAAGLAIITDPSQLDAERGVILGIEGGDAIGRDLGRLDTLHAGGVRVITLVHLAHNRIGTTSLPWHAYLRRLPLPAVRRRGLTPFGADVVRRMNDLGILIDVSHADGATLDGITSVTTRPVIASHSGSHAVEHFARNLSDDEIRRVAATGGLIGLWPYHFGAEGPADLGELVEHARHIAAVAGADHLCVGTDLNGVPGATRGAGDATAMHAIGTALRDAGFSDAEVRGILGENVRRVWRRVTEPAL